MRTITALIACEESQAICIELRKRGWDAYSCDIQECSGVHPEWHIQQDVTRFLRGSHFNLQTQDGQFHYVERWDFIMAHPPCTYLANSGSRFLNPDIVGKERAEQRRELQEEAIKFFENFKELDATFTAIENPLGVMSKRWRQPDLIIQPWMWGDNAIKSTCLWTKNLPPLMPDFKEIPDTMEYVTVRSKRTGRETRICKWMYETSKLRGDERRKVRSKTFPGIARAIADQWGRYIEEMVGE